MTLKEFIKTKKLDKNIFIALYNTDKMWIICGPLDDHRFSDYLDYTVTELPDMTKSQFIISLQMTDYTDDMQVGYRRMKEEMQSLVAVTKKDVKKPRRKK